LHDKAHNKGVLKMSAIVVHDGSRIELDLEAAQQVASFVVSNSYTLRFIWNYSFILFPLLLCSATLLFRVLWCVLVTGCGVSRRFCNVVTLFFFASALVLGSLLFLGLYPVLVTEV
jgi:hypothetical protein